MKVFKQLVDTIEELPNQIKEAKKKYEEAKNVYDKLALFKEKQNSSR